jgi:hypothetical protein
MVAFEESELAIAEWAAQAGWEGWSTIENRQRNFHFGTVAAEAALKALISRLKKGPSERSPYARGVDAEELARTLALAIDRRRSELQLVEHRSHDTGARGMFDDPAVGDEVRHDQGDVLGDAVARRQFETRENIVPRDAWRGGTAGDRSTVGSRESMGSESLVRLRRDAMSCQQRPPSRRLPHRQRTFLGSLESFPRRSPRTPHGGATIGSPNRSNSSGCGKPVIPTMRYPSQAKTITP